MLTILKFFYLNQIKQHIETFNFN